MTTVTEKANNRQNLVVGEDGLTALLQELDVQLR